MICLLVYIIPQYQIPLSYFQSSLIFAMKSKAKENIKPTRFHLTFK